MKGKPIIGVWRSWLAHLVWDQRVLCSSHSTPTFYQRNLLNSAGSFFLKISCSHFTDTISSVAK